MSDIKEYWPVLGVPVFGMLLNIYHKMFVGQRLAKVEHDNECVSKDIVEMKTDIKWIRETIEKRK